jgi:hypothetical protein
VFDGTLWENLTYLRDTPRPRSWTRRSRSSESDRSWSGSADRRIPEPPGARIALGGRAPADHLGQGIHLAGAARRTRRGDLPPGPDVRSAGRADFQPSPRLPDRDRAPDQLGTAGSPDPRTGRAHQLLGTHEELLAQSTLYRDLVGRWEDGAGPAAHRRAVDAREQTTSDGRQGLVRRARLQNV